MDDNKRQWVIATSRDVFISEWDDELDIKATPTRVLMSSSVLIASGST